ncbi:MAG: HNH endonuclease [Acidobacteriota bacterium]|nr:HNH endonuclease [Acidobacteriota bacterium]
MGVLGANAGAKHYAWKGGRRIVNGRVLVYMPEHPRAHRRHRCVFEHVLVAERALGRYLETTAVVHHVDEDPLNNRNDNLAILQDRSEHMRLHARLRVQQAGGNPWTEALCGTCRQLKPLTEFAKKNNASSRGDRTSQCRQCAIAYHQRRRDAAKQKAA